MRKKRFSRFYLLLIVCLSVLAGIWLFNVSQSVQTAEKKLADLQAEIMREKKTVRVLEAEWDYLNRPARLEKLSRTYLDLGPVNEKQLLRESVSLPVQAKPLRPATKPADDQSFSGRGGHNLGDGEASDD